jgi:hypothetical protein
MAIRVLLPYYALKQDVDYPEVSFDQSSLSDDAPFGNKVRSSTLSHHTMGSC